MKIPQTIEDINFLINSKVEESLQLEYKAADALTNKSKIAKEVSAMANAAGGIIIYGVKEFDEEDKKHLPEKISPIERKVSSRERLEQIINSNITPKIKGFLIHSIDINDDCVIYVVEIPQSYTAHQNTVDHKYYIRGNFESVPMLDYQIRDIMNRNKHPQIELLFEIEESVYKEVNTTPGQGTSIAERMKNGNSVEVEKRKTELIITPINIGTVLAKYIHYIIHFPKDILDENEVQDFGEIENGVLELYVENITQDSLYREPFVGIARNSPLLPKMKGISRRVELKNTYNDNMELEWTVFADNAEAYFGRVRLKDFLKKIK